MSEKTDRILEQLAEWSPSLMVLGGGALWLVAPPRGNLESGIFLVAGFAVALWLAQAAAALFDNRRQPGVWRQSGVWIRLCAVVVVLAVAALRQHASEVLASMFSAAVYFGGLALATVAVVSVMRAWQARASRKGPKSRS